MERSLFQGAQFAGAGGGVGSIAQGLSKRGTGKGLIRFKRPPYSSETEDQKHSSRPRQSLADRGNGRMSVRAHSKDTASWDWGRCVLGQTFVIDEEARDITPTYRLNFEPLAQTTRIAGGLFEPGLVQLDAVLFFHNLTTGGRTAHLHQLYANSATAGGLPGRFPFLPPKLDLEGSGQAGLGDRVSASIALIARAKAPVGEACYDCTASLVQIDLYHKV